MTSRRRRQERPLKRRVGNRRELRTIVVFTEGKNSEPDYVNALKRLPHIANSISISIEIDPEHGVPLTLVEKAIDRKVDDEIDESWCLFDVEWPLNHPNMREAISLAKNNDVGLAISNPCFEVWLILHHEDLNRWCDTAQAERRSRALDGRPGKSLPSADQYMPLRTAAVARAKHLDLRHQRDGTVFPHDNPSSGVYKFVEVLDKVLPNGR